VSEEPEQTLSLRTLPRDHPVITAILVVCTLAGALIGALYLPGEWHLARRIAAGAVSGAGTALLLTFTRLYGL
jgi:hypothetical protein